MRSFSVDTCGKQTQIIAQQHAPAPYATAHDLYSQRYPLYVSSTAFLRAASTGGEHAVHAVCRVRYSCVRACLAARGLAWDTNRVQRRQRSRRRARPPSSLRRCCERSLPAHAECTWQSSAVQAFRMGPSVGTEGDPCTVLNAHAGSVTCDPGIWREASRAVCSYFRKSKPVHCEMPIWRCNASFVTFFSGTRE